MDNNPIVGIIPFLNMDSVWLGLKILYLLAFLVYVGFTIIVMSQIKQMSNTIVSGFDKQLSFFSWIYFGLAVLALVLAFMVL